MVLGPVKFMNVRIQAAQVVVAAVYSAWDASA